MDEQNTKPTIKLGLLIVVAILYAVKLIPGIRTSQMMWFAVAGFVMVCFAYVLIKKGKIKGNFMTKWIYANYAFFSLSILWCQEKTFPNTLKTLLLIFAIGLLMLYTLESLKDIEKIMGVVQGAVVISALYILLMVDRSQLGDARLGSLMEETMNSNIISMKMCLGLPLSFYFLKKSKTNFWKIYNIVSIILFAFVIFYSGSRNGLLTMLATCICYMLVRAKGLKRFWAILGSVLLVVGVYIFIMNYKPIYNVLGSRIEEMINGFFGESNDSSFDWRELMIKEGWRYFTESPIIGHGTDGFRYLFGAQHGFETYSHNNYIELLVGGGLLGFCLYYSIYFHVFKGLWKYASGEIDPMATCLLVTNASMLVSHISGVLYYSWEINTFLVLGALYISIKKGKKSNDNEERTLEEKVYQNT